MRPYEFVAVFLVAVTSYSQQIPAHYKPQATPRPSFMPQGMIRAASFSPATGELLALVHSTNPSLPLSVVDMEGPNTGRVRPVPANPASILTFNEKYLIWNQPTPINSILHIHSLKEGTERTLITDLRGIVSMSITGDDLIAASKHSGTITLAKVNLQTGKLDRWDEFTDDAPVLCLHQSSPDAMLLVDQGNARFKRYRLDAAPNSAPWITISSSLVYEVKNKPRGGTSAFPAMGQHWILIGHYEGLEDTHWFLIAHSEKGVGRYAIQVDRNGRELRRALFHFADGNPRMLGFTGFSTVIQSQDRLRILNMEGTLVRYETLSD
jgi:hypothetical protein